MNSTAMDLIKRTGYLFYLVNPRDNMVERIEDLPNPDHSAQAIPVFLALLLVEFAVIKFRGKGGFRLNDGATSIGNGILYLLTQMFLKGITMKAYIWVFENYRWYDLPWDSLSTWLVAALGYDLTYYWFHRACHEFNFMWAAHQVHHSSEDYNLTTALRQSIFQNLWFWPFGLPMALFVPPSIMMIHGQLNLLFQFWIHTEVIDSLGPLEYVLNTASHHRVHHGSNRYCLDKNYAGVLIIWDKMFGTFEPERKDEDIVYGLVDQPQFFNPIRHQLFYYYGIWKKAMSMKTWRDSLWAVVKGPGWFPGTPRLGNLEDVPEKQDRKRYDPYVPMATKGYLLVHLAVSSLYLNGTLANESTLNHVQVLGTMCFFVWSTTSFGMLFDGQERWGWLSELLRSAATFSSLTFFGILPAFGTLSLLTVNLFAASVPWSLVALVLVLRSNPEGSKKRA